MPVRKIEGLKKVTLNLTETTVLKLQDLYPGLGYQRAVRSILDNHVTQLAAKRARAVEGLVTEIDIGEME